MSSNKSLIHLIQSLEKKEFDTLVKMYLKHKYNFKEIIITDGKDDIGLDLKVFDFKERKRQYQLTTQKSGTTAEKNALKYKIFEDLNKAKLNYENYRYERKLIFFYSYTLTNKFIRDIEEKADFDYDLHLEIIDANHISQAIEGIDEILKFLYSKIGLSIPGLQSNNDNLLYDLISFGTPTEFKNQIIHAYLFQILFIKKEMSFIEIKESLDQKFQTSKSDNYYSKIINPFLTDRSLIKNKEKDTYALSEDLYSQLKSKQDEFLLERGLFKINVENILKKYDQEAHLELYIEKLVYIYTNNFENGLDEICSNKEAYQISDLYNDFSVFIDTKLGKEFDHKELAIELLRLCKENKFIQKLAASNVYVDRINDKKLDTYLNTSKKIFIDTSIALYSLCYWFMQKTTYDNFFFVTVKNLIEELKNENIKVFISERYIWEIANHFKDAFRLAPFTKIINTQNLGDSKNVFYNFYKFLKAKDEYTDSFIEFLKGFELSENSNQEMFNSKISYYLSHLNIEKQVIPKEYNIQNLNELFDNYLRKSYKVKTTFAKNCDSIMFAYLADKDVETHQLDPIFLTWDKSFFEVHREFSIGYPDNQKWLNLSPNKYLDSNALLKFSINNETFTDNLLAFISDDIISNTRSLIDSLAIIINPSNEVGREYTKKLGELREKEIYQIANKEVIMPDNYEGDAILDDVVFNLTDHYKEKGQIQDFISLFTQQDLIEKIVDLIKCSTQQVYSESKINDSIYVEFDELINRFNLK